jgi:hypothetical protein
MLRNRRGKPMCLPNPARQSRTVYTHGNHARQSRTAYMGQTHRFAPTFRDINT